MKVYITALFTTANKWKQLKCLSTDEQIKCGISIQWNINSCCLVAKSCMTLLQPHGLWPTRLLCPWDFPGKNTGVGCHFLLQGIFLTQGSNPGVLHWQVDSLPLSHLGSPCLVTKDTQTVQSHQVGVILPLGCVRSNSLCRRIEGENQVPHFKVLLW